MLHKKKKTDRIFHGKPVRGTTPLITSHLSDTAKIRTDIEETRRKLLSLSEQVKGINQVKGFLRLLWEALGIDKSVNVKGGSPSRYAAFKCKDGSTRIITVRASAHNSKSSTFIEDGNINGDNNLSVVLQSKRKKNSFQACNSVNMEEYVYVDDRIKNIENPLSQIATSLANYLETGYYHNSTGVAFIHYSPFNPALSQNITIDAHGNAIPSSQNNHGADYIPESKTHRYMKNRIKLSESTLKQIIAESMRKVMGENTVDEKRFLPILKKTYNNLYSEYERWQYAKYKPQGMDDAIEAIINAMHDVNDIIERIEPLPENPHLEDI